MKKQVKQNGQGSRVKLGFKLPDDCPCCVTFDGCEFKRYYETIIKAVARETLIRNIIGHGKRHPTVQRFRNCLYQVVAKQIVDRLGISHHHRRIILPNCVTSGVRGMLCGNGQFVGCKPKENANPNDA